MAVKIRMRMQGRRNRPFYRIVVADARSPRDGRFIETVGWYNPVEKDESKQFEVKADRIEHWLKNGAQLTEKTGKLIARAAPEVAKAHREKQQQRKAKDAARRRKKAEA